MVDRIVPSWPAPANVHALCTTRIGGYSEGPHAGLNLAAHVGDSPVAVAANRQQLRRLLPATPLWMNQVHGARCVPAEAAWHGIFADACVAHGANVVCAVLTADCLPVLLCDERGTAVAAVHAGWRGIAAGVVEAAIREMAVPRGRLLAWLGPAIGPQAYEVGDDVRKVFLNEDWGATAAFERRGEKWLCDLYALARRRLAAAGVSRVFGGGLCTFRDGGRFFSFRRDGTTGRMASVIWLSPQIR